MAEFALVQLAAPGATGNQSFTVAGFGTPKAAMFFVTYGITAGVAVNDTGLFIGATDGTRNIAAAHTAQDNLTTTVCKTRGLTTKCISIRDNTGASTLGEANWNAWVTDGVQVNWTTAPATAYLVTCLLIGGGVLNAYSDLADVSFTLDAETVITAPNFQPTLLLCFNTDANPWNGTVQPGARPNFGWVYNDGTNPPPQRCLEQQNYDAHAGGPSIGAKISTSRAGTLQGDGSSSSLEIEIKNFTSTGFSTFRRTLATGGGTLKIGYVAIQLPGTIAAKSVSATSPTSTGSYSITGVGFTPQFGIGYLSSLTAEDTVTANTAAVEVVGISLFTALEQHTIGIASDQGVGTSNEESITSSKVISLRKDGGVYQVEDFTNFTSDGVTFNATTANSTAVKRAYLFVQVPPSTPTPIVPGGRRMVGLI